MKITVLAENTTLSNQLMPEHGLSLLIETEKYKILFDMGQSDLFLKNAKEMCIDLSDVDVCVLSHGHYDHGGGLETFLQENQHAPIYVSQYAYGDFYNAEEKYIGLNPALKGESRIILTGSVTPIGHGCTLFSCNDFYRLFPAPPQGLTERCGEHTYSDRFLHEQYLLINENGKRILFSGCSHKGIMNIIRWFQPDIFVGGFHLMKTETDTPTGKAHLNDVAEMLKKENVRCYTGHCTGDKQYHYLKDILNDQLSYLSTGSQFTL